MEPSSFPVHHSAVRTTSRDRTRTNVSWWPRSIGKSSTCFDTEPGLYRLIQITVSHPHSLESRKPRQSILSLIESLHGRDNSWSAVNVLERWALAQPWRVLAKEFTQTRRTREHTQLHPSYIFRAIAAGKSLPKDFMLLGTDDVLGVLHVLDVLDVLGVLETLGGA